MARKHRRRSRGLGAASSSMTQTILLWGGAGVALGLLVGSMLRPDDGKTHGLGAMPSRVTRALRMQAAQLRSRQRIAAVRPAVRAAAQHAAAYPSFNTSYPQLASTLQGSGRYF